MFRGFSGALSVNLCWGKKGSRGRLWWCRVNNAEVKTLRQRDQARGRQRRERQADWCLRPMAGKHTGTERRGEERGNGKRKELETFFIVAFSLGCWFDFNSYRSLWLFSSLFKSHFRAKQNLIERKGEAISIGITPLEKRGGILLETEKCVCVCNPLAPPIHTHTHTHGHYRLQTHTTDGQRVSSFHRHHHRE